MPVRKADKTVNKPVKLLLYGDTGAGKTHFALHATPGATLVFDAESGTDLFEGMVDFDYWVNDDSEKSQSVVELRKCIDYCRTPEGQKKYKTLVIDTITVIWEAIQQDRQDYKEVKAAQKAEERGGEYSKEFETDFGTFNQFDWQSCKKAHKSIILDLLNLPQNVIVLAQEKEIVNTKPNGDMERTGEYTWDGEKTLKRAFDYAVRLIYDEKTDKRYLVLLKSRAQEFKKGMRIENATFDFFVKTLAEKRGLSTTVRAMATSEANVFEADETIPSLKVKIKEACDAIRATDGSEETKSKLLAIIVDKVGIVNYNAVNDIEKLKLLLSAIEAFGETKGV